MYSNFISNLRKDFKSYLVWENTVFSVVEVIAGKTKRQHEDQDTNILVLYLIDYMGYLTFLRIFRQTGKTSI